MNDTESLIRAAYARHLDEAPALMRQPALPSARPRIKVALITTGAAVGVAAVAVGATVLLRGTNTTQQPAVGPSPSSAQPTATSPNGIDSQASAACRAVFGADAASASSTTVGTVRGWTIGPAATAPTSPFAGSFPGDTDDDYAVWCWVNQDGAWNAYAVDSHGTKVNMNYHITGSSTPPYGPPGLP